MVENKHIHIQRCPSCNAEIRPTSEGELKCSACGYSLSRVDTDKSQKNHKTQKDIILDKILIFAEKLLRKEFETQKSDFEKEFQESYQKLKSYLSDNVKNIHEVIKHKENELTTTIDKSLKSNKQTLDLWLTEAHKQAETFFGEKSKGFDEIVSSLKNDIETFTSVKDNHLSEVETGIKSDVSNFIQGQKMENDQYRNQIRDEIHEESIRQKEMLDGMLRDFESRFQSMAEQLDKKFDELQTRFTNSFEEYTRRSSGVLQQEFQIFNKAVLTQLSEEYGVEPPPEIVSNMDPENLPALKLVEDKKTG